MNTASFSARIALAIAVGLGISAVSGHAQSASATISYTAAGGGNYDYTVTLFNSSTTYDLQSFWYGWTGSGNNLPSDPTSAGNTLGWANNLDNNSIMWEGSAATELAPGHSGTFTFVSSSSPTAITTAPSGGSVAYVGSIDFSQGAAGDSTGAFYPVVAPEPSSAVLLAVGAAVLGLGLRSRVMVRK